MLIKSINLYLAKNFISKFLQLTLAFSLLIFLINFIEIFNRTQANTVDFSIKILMALYNVPQFINEISSSLVLLSAIFCYYTLSSRSEITIIRNSGLSLWHIAKPISLCALFLGIFWITIFQPLSIKTSRLLENLENINFGDFVDNKIKKHSNYNSSSSIWLRQENIEEIDEDIIINAQSIDQNDLKFYNVNLWFFDKNGIFYKRIDSEEMILLNNNLILKNNIVNEQSLIFNNENIEKNFTLLSKEGNKNLNQKIPKIIIKTNLDANFILKKILNNTNNINKFNIFEIPRLIKDMDNSGLNSQKYRVRLHYLANLWLIFIAMTLIACYFGINHIRNQKSIIMIVIGIVTGVAFYIASTILNSIGSSGLISVFASTWSVSLICVSIGILLIYSKEKN